MHGDGVRRLDVLVDPAADLRLVREIRRQCVDGGVGVSRVGGSNGHGRR
ncbi:hypothetical protein [Streptomyces sp. 8K308]|nr:hypothetical protein [Streptomyces sp. 8K308]